MGMQLHAMKIQNHDVNGVMSVKKINLGQMHYLEGIVMVRVRV